jgi:hypothetical protein
MLADPEIEAIDNPLPNHLHVPVSIQAAEAATTETFARDTRAKAQNPSERLAFVEEFIKRQHSQAHDAGMQAQDHAHERGLAKQQQDADSMSQAIDQAHQMGMAQVHQPQEGE